MTAPRNAKKPQDHKPKATPATAKNDGEPIRELEFHGKTYTVDTSAADDIDIMDALTDAKITGDEAGYAVAFTLMLRGVLGADYPRWKSEQRAIHGRVGSELMREFIEAAGLGN